MSGDADVDVRVVDSAGAFERAVPVLRELWTVADEGFVRAFREDPEYTALGAYPAGNVGTDSSGAPDSVPPLEVAGVSVQSVLHHARHAWVHDFVVTEAARGRGVGRALLAGVEAWARERDCAYVALAVRNGNEDAAGFYETTGMTDWGRIYETELE